MKYYILLLLPLFAFVSCDNDPNTYALISTDVGDIKVKLYETTPRHKENFIDLANKGFYKDLLFHRVMKEFMIQGGDPDSRGAAPGQMLGQGGPGYTIEKEFGALHVKGALAAARQPDQVNPQKASSGSQFYIVQGKTWTDAELDQIEQMRGITYTPEQRELYKTVGGTPFLDNDYTVFGEVVEGLEVVDKIAVVQTGAGDRPTQDVKMDIKILD